MDEQTRARVQPAPDAARVPEQDTQRLPVLPPDARAVGTFTQPTADEQAARRLLWEVRR